MKIEAIYMDKAVGLETKIVIVDCFGGGNVLCLNEYGELFMAKMSEVKVTDKRYLAIVKEQVK